jgi:hypothetical protein
MPLLESSEGLAVILPPTLTRSGPKRLPQQPMRTRASSGSFRRLAVASATDNAAAPHSKGCYGSLCDNAHLKGTGARCRCLQLSRGKDQQSRCPGGPPQAPRPRSQGPGTVRLDLKKL